MVHDDSRRPALRRLLLVEDDPDTASLMADVVTERFAAAQIVRCGSVGETRSIDLEGVDLALCDFHLPDGTGHDALRILLQRRSDLPVVMVTALGDAAAVVRSIRLGAIDYMVKSADYLDLLPLTIEKALASAALQRDNRKLAEALAESLATTEAKNAELSRLVSRLESLAMTDPLTGLANRRALSQRLVECFSRAQRYGTELSCLMIDLDGFKAVNDVLGHQAGDELLRIVAQLIRTECRLSDVAARAGGDEFVVLLPHTGAEMAAGLALRLQRALAEAHRTRPSEPEGQGSGETVMSEAARAAMARFGMSIGIGSRLVSHPRSGEELVEHADRALYEAKNRGKGRIELYRAIPGDQPRAVPA